MRITEVRISSFGSKKDFRAVYEDGLNIIEGNNESGKSTVCEFIRFVLYGFDNGEREKYTPFLSSVCSGTVTLTDGEHTYVAARAETKTKKDVKVYKDGIEVEGIKHPGEYLYGIPSSALFRSTVFVGQNRAKTEENAPSEVQNLLFTGDENVSAASAVKNLDRLRKELKLDRGHGGLIDDLVDKIGGLNYVLSQNADEEEEIKKLEKDIEDYDAKLANDDAAFERIKNREIDWRIKKQREENARIEREKAEYEQAEGRRKDFETLHRYGDRMPGTGDLTALVTCAANLKNDTDDLNRAKDNVIGLVKDRKRAEKALETRKKENLREIEKVRTKRTVCSVFVAVFIVLMIILVGLTAFFAAKRRITLAVTFGVTSLAALALVFVMMKIVQGTGTRINELEDAPDEKAELERIKNEIVYASEQVREENGIYSESFDKYEKEAGKWNLTSNNGVAELQDIISEYERLSKEAGEKNRIYIGDKTAFDIRMRSEDEPSDDGREINLPPDYNDGTYQKDYRTVKTLKDAHVREQTQKRFELERRRGKIRPKAEVMEELNEYQPRLDAAKAKYDAVVLAKKAIDAAAEDIRRNVSPRLAAEAEKYYAVITDGKYTELGVDPGFNMTFKPDDGAGGNIARGTEYMSGGTRDASYLSLRLALTDLVGEKSCPPLILDETLSQLDNGRALKALTVLAESGKQVLLFTSSDRERAIASAAGIRCSCLGM